MGSRKRGRQQLAAAAVEEGMLNIKLAEGPSLAAKALILRCCSTVAEGLPADAQEWDISNLMVEGEPVARSTMLCWLNCAYSRILNTTFEKQEGEDIRGTVSGLASLLAFADAVGSSAGVLAACLDKVEDLKMDLELAGEDVALWLDGGVYYFEEDDDVHINDARYLFLSLMTPDNDDGITSFCNVEEARALKSAVAEQTEALLFQAHKLQLQPLIERLHAFIAACTYKSGGVLYGILAQVFTERLLEVVLPVRATQAAKDAWISSVLTLPLGFVPAKRDTLNCLLRPCSGRSAPKLVFDAELRQDFLGSRQGTQVEVCIDLLGTSKVQIGAVSCPVQLLLGHPIAAATGSLDGGDLMTGGGLIGEADESEQGSDQE